MVDFILKRMPDYGDFTIKSLLGNGGALDSTLENFGITTEQNRIEIANYLTSNGYAITTRQNIPQIGYIELTDKGRKLKALGSIQKYLDYSISELGKVDRIEKENAKMARRTLDLMEQQVWINIVIAIGVIIAAAYYIIQIQDGQPKAHPCFSIVLKVALLTLIGIGIAIAIRKYLIKHKANRD